MIMNATSRFSNRVDAYDAYRPHYPGTILPFLTEAISLRPSDVIADIGSGTGISCELFLENKNTVHAVEPNPDMRAVAERRFSANPNFISGSGTAETTTLADASIDVVVAGQAFHWFDRSRARTEFLRILRGENRVVLMWNDRDVAATPMDRDYESLLHEFAIDYDEVAAKYVLDAAGLADFFGPSGARHAAFPNPHRFDLAGLKGRLLSSSYVPAPDDPRCAPMLAALERIVERHALDGIVSLSQTTNLYVGFLH